MSQSSSEAEIIGVTTKLLGAVGCGDYDTYSRLSDASLTCVEPETQGNIIEGLAFHKYFFDLGRATFLPERPPPKLNTVSSPHVRMLGPDHALIVYIRVIQQGDKISTAEETRIWKRDGVSNEWKNVHFHVRDPPLPAILSRMPLTTLTAFDSRSRAQRSSRL